MLWLLATVIVLWTAAAAPAQAAEGDGVIGGQWRCVWIPNDRGVPEAGTLLCIDQDSGTLWSCAPFGSEFACRNLAGPTPLPGAQQALENALAGNPDSIPPRPGTAQARTPTISPPSQVTSPYCIAVFRVTVPQSATVAKTLRMSWGDGGSQSYNVPAGSGDVTLDVSHQYPMSAFGGGYRDFAATATMTEKGEPIGHALVRHYEPESGETTHAVISPDPR